MNLNKAFKNTPCSSTSCGVAMQDVFGICEPWARPCLIGTKERCYITSPTLIIIIIIVPVLLAGFCFYRRRKASMMDKADEPSGSLPKSNPEPTELPPQEATTVAPEAEESPREAEETLQETLFEEPPPPPARSWFGRAEPEPESEEAERPPAPARSWWFGRAGPEPEPEEPPLSPFSALRAERARELKMLANP